MAEANFISHFIALASAPTPPGDGLQPELVRLLIQRAGERIHDLARQYYGGQLGTYTLDDVDTCVEHATATISTDFLAINWPSDFIERLVTAADQVRMRLLDVAACLQKLHKARTMSDAVTTDDIDKVDPGWKRRTGSGDTPPIDELRKGDPLERWKASHRAAAALPPPTRATWLLAHYLGLSARDSGHVGGPQSTFDALNRMAWQDIANRIAAHDDELDAQVAKATVKKTKKRRQ